MAHAIGIMRSERYIWGSRTRTNHKVAEFYKNFRNGGKSTNVVSTVVIHKLLIISNARMRDFLLDKYLYNTLNWKVRVIFALHASLWRRDRSKIITKFYVNSCLKIPILIWFQRMIFPLFKTWSIVDLWKAWFGILLQRFLLACVRQWCFFSVHCFLKICFSCNIF